MAGVSGRIRVGVAGSATGAPTWRATSPRCRAASCLAAATPTPPRRARRRPLPERAPTGDLDELLADPELDAVVLATPVPTHAALAERVLEPASTASWRSRSRHGRRRRARVAAAEGAGRLLMVGHLLEYHPGVAKLKEIADSGELGDLHYIYSQPAQPRQAARGRERALDPRRPRRVGAAAPGRRGAVRVHARGESYMHAGVEDVVFAYMRFPSGLAAHLHLSWLDPHKERRFTVVGSQADGDFDDMELEHKLTVYDKGFDQPSRLLRRVHHPLGRHLEPARSQPRAAADRVRALRRASGRAAPRSDGHSGLRVVGCWRRSRRALRAHAGGSSDAAV